MPGSKLLMHEVNWLQLRLVKIFRMSGNWISRVITVPPLLAGSFLGPYARLVRKTISISTHIMSAHNNTLSWLFIHRLVGPLPFLASSPFLAWMMHDFVQYELIKNVSGMKQNGTEMAAPRSHKKGSNDENIHENEIMSPSFPHS